MKPTIIFDFDGTIADTLWLVTAIYEQIFGVVVTEEQKERVRNMSAAHAIKELKVPVWRAPKLLTEGKRIMSSRMHEVKPFPGMPELILQLQTEGYTLRIMSSNSEENVRSVLLANGLEGCFSSVDGGVGLFVKAPALRKLMRLHNIDKGSVYYVGDEARDIDGAKKAGVPIIAVGWGYNSPQFLQSLRPSRFAATPADIKTIVESLESGSA
jgi:phosphoglycolate phosphatase